MTVRFRVESIGTWGDVETPVHARLRPQFVAGWADTVSLLCREVDLLGGREVVVAIDVNPADVRKSDGLPTSRARYGPFPGARVTFDSRHGALVYGTDVYTAGGRYRPGRSDGAGGRTGGSQTWAPAWQHNVRAIALSLEALRAVDRHGVTRRGQQYAGFRALPPGGIALGSGGPFPTPHDAAAWLAEQAAGVGLTETAGELLDVPARVRRAYRALALKLHPDAGGERADWDRLEAAVRMLGGT